MVHTARLTMICLLVPIFGLLCMTLSGSSSDGKGNDVGKRNKKVAIKPLLQVLTVLPLDLYPSSRHHGSDV